MNHRTRTGGATGLRSRTLGSLLDADIPTREPILGTWLTQRHLSMLYAPAGVGKSMATFSIALAVAGGGTFLQWAAHRPRKVLLVDGEMDVADLKERAALLLQALPKVDLGAARVNLEVFAQQDQHPEATFPDLATPEGREEIVKRAKKHAAELVILDNFSTLVTVEDENSASSFNPVVELMQKLKSHGCAVNRAPRQCREGEGILMAKTNRRPVGALDNNGHRIVEVPLANHGLPAILFAEDYEKLVAQGLSKNWTYNASGKRHLAYVRAGHTKVRLVTVARVLTDAQPGEVVRYRNGDRLDLRNSNLRIAHGKSKRPNPFAAPTVH